MGSRGQHILLYFPFCANSHGSMALLVLPISLRNTWKFKIFCHFISRNSDQRKYLLTMYYYTRVTRYLTIYLSIHLSPHLPTSFQAVLWKSLKILEPSFVCILTTVSARLSMCNLYGCVYTMCVFYTSLSYKYLYILCICSYINTYIKVDSS